MPVIEEYTLTSRSELNEFVRDHFQAVITNKNRETIKVVWNKLFDALILMKEDWDVLKQEDFLPSNKSN